MSKVKCKTNNQTNFWIPNTKMELRIGVVNIEDNLVMERGQGDLGGWENEVKD